MALPSHGAKLLLHDGATPGEFAEVSGVGDFGVPFPTVENEDVTAHDSEGWRERVNTIRDGSEITIPLNFRHSNELHRELVMAANSIDNERRFQIHAPDDTVLADFNALVSVDGSGMLPVAGAQTVQLGLQVNGRPEFPFLDES